MINLMPPKERQEIVAARSNTLLIRYIILLIGALIFLAGALGITYVTLDQTASRADETRQNNEQKASGYAQAQATATQLRNDLAAAKTLFADEIRYSLVVTRLANLLPSGTAIDSLQVTSDSFSEPVSLSVGIRNRAAAEALQQNFMSSPYVTNVSLGSVSTSPESSSYPYTIELEFTFDRSIGQ